MTDGMFCCLSQDCIFPGRKLWLFDNWCGDAVFSASEAAHSGRFRWQRLSAAGIHEEHAGQTYVLPRNHPTS